MKIFFSACISQIHAPPKILNDPSGCTSYDQGRNYFSHYFTMAKSPGVMSGGPRNVKYRRFPQEIRDLTLCCMNYLYFFYSKNNS